MCALVTWVFSWQRELERPKSSKCFPKLLLIHKMFHSRLQRDENSSSGTPYRRAAVFRLLYYSMCVCHNVCLILPTGGLPCACFLVSFFVAVDWHKQMVSGDPRGFCVIICAVYVSTCIVSAREQMGLLFETKTSKANQGQKYCWLNLVKTCTKINTETHLFYK